MSEFFDKAIDTILTNEGGYVNNAKDPGGATSLGISLRFLKDYAQSNPGDFDTFDVDDDGDIDAQDIKGLTKEGAKYLYKKQFWDKFKYDQIKNFLIARKVFDLCVNMYAAQAHKVVQRAIRAASGIKLLEDGILGPKSIAAINSADQTSLLAAIRSEAAGFYRLLAATKPDLQGFLQGWLSRAYS